MKRIRNIVLLLVVVIIVAAIAIAGCASSEKATEELTAAPATAEPEAETPTGTPQEETAALLTPEMERATPTPIPKPKIAKGPLAPEVVGIKAWINSHPLKIGDLKGKVVLVDFWTYTCVNCIRTFPYLKVWHAKYADDGLVILGVHSPEFTFEEKLENVRQAVKSNGIGWAVALDNDHATWKAYENYAWPAKYLIDKDGIIRYKHFGEGAYSETELKIRELLEEAGADLAQPDSDMPNRQPIDSTFLKDPSAKRTRELYALHVPYYLAQRKHLLGAVVTYEDPGKHKEDVIYLQGPWYKGLESLKHARETSDFEDYMALTFSAKSVNVVISPEGDKVQPFKVLVTLDGEDLTDSNKGEDVVIEENGRSFLTVDEPRMYSVIQAPSYGTYELKLSSNSAHFAVVSFTFGVYESGV